MNNNEKNFYGKYAEQRREILENHAPVLYKSMIENGTLAQHLMSVQDSAAEYVDSCVARFQNSDEYLKAEKENPAEAMRLLNMTTLEAEDAAYRIWVSTIPESGDEDEEENDDE